MWSQVVAGTPKAPALPERQLNPVHIREVATQAIAEQIEKLLPQILQQVTTIISNSMKFP